MMKDKILVFVIGLLVGAILASGGFLIYEKNNSGDTQNQSNTQMMERPEGGMPNGERPDGDMTPPEKPDGEEDGTRPEPPSRNNNNSSDKTNKKDSANESKNNNQ